MTRSPTYNHIISLGAWCQVAEQLRRHEVSFVSSPFDWLVTPFESLLRIIRNGGVQLCNDVAQYDGGQSAICTNYGVLYHHEFPRDTQDKVKINDDDRIVGRSKLLHKMANLDVYCKRDGRKLFIRLEDMSSPPARGLT